MEVNKLFNEQHTMILKQAFEIYNIEICNELERQMEGVTVNFSKKFDKKMSRLIFHQHQIYYPLINTTLKRVACFIIAAILSFSAIAYACKPVRKFFKEIFIQPLTSHVTRVTYTGNTQDAPTILKPITITYIPWGFKENFVDKEKSFVEYNYINKKGKYVRVIQALLKNTSCYQISAKAKTEQIEINGNEALYFEMQDYLGVYFTTKKYIYVVTGEISKEKVLKVARSIKE